MARGRERRALRQSSRPVDVPTVTAAEALLALGHYAEDNLPAPQGSADDWTMAALKPECQLVELGREPRPSYDEALVGILDRYALTDASFEPVVAGIADGSLFEAERQDSLQRCDLADLDARPRTLLARNVNRRLCGIARPGIPDPFPALLRRLLGHRDPEGVWVLGAEDHVSLSQLRSERVPFGAIYVDERTAACAQAALQVLDSDARVERVTYLADLPVDEALNPLGDGTFDPSAPIPETLVGLPGALPDVLSHLVRTGAGSDEGARSDYREWLRSLRQTHPGVRDDDSLTIALARELLPDEGGLAVLLTRSSQLTGLQNVELRTALVRQNLVRAVAQFKMAEYPNATGSIDLWILDTDRGEDEPVYLMRLDGPSQQERFPHLYANPFDEKAAGEDLDRIVDALTRRTAIPYVGAPIERERILAHPSASLRLVDYESSVDVGRSLREREVGNGGLGDLAEAYRSAMAEVADAEGAFFKAYGEYLDFLDR